MTLAHPPASAPYFFFAHAAQMPSFSAQTGPTDQWRSRAASPQRGQVPPDTPSSPRWVFADSASPQRPSRVHATLLAAGRAPQRATARPAHPLRPSRKPP